MRYAFLGILLLSLPARAQTGARWPDSNWTPPDVISVRTCRRPAEAKEAQVLAFDKTSLEAKLAVNLGNSEFKVVTVKLWDRSDDPRPVIPIIEAARITQGKLQFYTPNLNADPEPVHDKQFLLIATLGGAQVCWATESSLLKDDAKVVKSVPEPAVVKEATAPEIVRRPGSRRR
jgi:hypothetical protein